MPPADEGEARQRILAAAKSAIDERGDNFSLADVARTVGVTRQTVYRHFASTDELLAAAALDSTDGFLGRLTKRLRGIADPAEAIIEAFIATLELLPKDPYVNILLAPGHGRTWTQSVTSQTARQLTRACLDHNDVDWSAHGYTDRDLDELSEFVLRNLQSFLIDPGDPPRSRRLLRAYLQRWIGPAVNAAGR